MIFAPIRNIRLLGIADAGGKRERIRLSVMRACDIGKYVVIPCLRAPDGVEPSNELAYWFPDVPVAEGDFVILYSGNGKNRKSIGTDGLVRHMFYWGRGTESVWDSRVPTLLHVTAIQYGDDE